MHTHTSIWIFVPASQCTNICKHKCAHWPRGISLHWQSNAITQLWRALRVQFQRVHKLIYRSDALLCMRCLGTIVFCQNTVLYRFDLKVCFLKKVGHFVPHLFYIIYADTCACFSFLSVPKHTSCCTCCWLRGGVSHRPYLCVPVWEISG